MESSSAGVWRILVVEDEPGICEVCRRTLIPEGYQVDTAVNGVAAQNMLLEKDYDLFIIDIRTPVMNGRQLYGYINNTHPKLIDRIIFTTGDVISNDIQSFINQNSRPFLLKPFTPDELKALVRETLKRIEK